MFFCLLLVLLEAHDTPGEFDQVWYFEALDFESGRDNYSVIYLDPEVSLVYACRVNQVKDFFISGF